MKNIIKTIKHTNTHANGNDENNANIESNANDKNKSDTARTQHNKTNKIIKATQQWTQ